MGNSSAAPTFAPAHSAIEAVSRAAIQRTPWYVWCLTAAVLCDSFGLYWDISWHISIGRDTFWTPAHMMIYAAGILAGISCGYAILSTTFAPSREAKDCSVSIWGFSGPLGCFVAAWGGAAMLTSVPFDNWWHSAYGLDVRIVSLPHSILVAGETMITLGAILLVCAHVNRASEKNRDKLDRLLLFLGALEVFGAAIFMLQSTYMDAMHSVHFYRAVATGFPITLIAISMVSQSKRPMTTMAAIYTVLFLAFLWIFPLFPAQPKLGPVYQHITHMVPLWFPTLLIVPAFALDLLREKLDERWISWSSAPIAGSMFLAVFIAAQWPFGDFMMSPAARNPIFGANYFPYNVPAGLLFDPFRFVDFDHLNSAQFAAGMATNLALAIVFCGIGTVIGRWMRKVQR
jgi:hypothetical protein